ncbi:plasmid mobilization protein [Hymenobacter latericus]|uniref:plasmid mobilization protein n=1 Tax=Hymenobacter sp. YIM 151858-1 TaxID=2987688 RepID=UPI0022263BC7|nr:mobilization protein [Hymenobacter sp. YIM 151858-1]UYZ61220.1 mobilization protein [Hymenobacter sp. YIM 151858-1]
MLRFRVSEHERRVIESKASRAGLKLSDFLRDCALDKPVREAVPLEVVRGVIGVANALNQLARLAREGRLGRVGEQELLERLEELKTLLR